MKYGPTANFVAGQLVACHLDSCEKYDDNNDLSVMMFDINHGYRRKEDAIRLEMVHISKQESRRNNEHGLNTRYRLHTHTQSFSNLV